MPKKTLGQLTEAMYYVLMALADGEKCGTQIADYAMAKTGGAVSIGPATLYTILAKFQTEGYIRESAVNGRKRTYAVTEAGLAAYQAELRRLWRCVTDASPAKQDDAAEQTAQIADALRELYREVLFNGEPFDETLPPVSLPGV